MADRVAFSPLDRRGDRFGTERHRHHVLHVGNHQAVARQPVPIGNDVEVVASEHPLGIGTRRTWNRFQNGLDLAGNLLHRREVVADDLDAHRRANAGRQHVDARLDRHRPGVGDAGELQRLVHFRDEAVERQSRPPLLLGLRLMMVSNISSGAGSVAVSARPALP